MAIRLSGLSSGLDTEAIVGALVSAYSYKKDKYVKAQTKLSWKQEAWKSLNTKVNTLYKSVGNLRYSSAYSAKKCTVSDKTKANVIASDNAMVGTQSLKIKRLAQAAYVTGAKLKADPGKEFTKKSTLADLGYNLGSANGRIEVSTADKSTAIDVTSSTTIGEFVDKLNQAGVKANFDEANQRIFVSSNGTGKENDFKITAENSAGIKALSSMGLFSSESVSDFSDVADLFSITDTYDPDAVFSQITDKVRELKGAYYAKDKKATTDEEKAEVEAAKATLADPENKKWLEFFNYSEDEWCTKTADEIKSFAMSKVDTAVKLDNTATLKAGSSYEAIAALGDYDSRGMINSDATSSKINSFITSIKEKYATIANEDATDEEKETAKAELDTLIDNNADLAATLRDTFGYEIEKSDSADFDMAKDFMTSLTDDKKAADVKSLTSQIEMAASIVNPTIDVDYDYTASRVDAEDALIELNGAEFESASNNITVNGLTIECMATTANANVEGGFDTLTITTSNDTSGLYDTVKNFISSYNSLINEMMSLYNADAAKDYEPLTDDEKAEMSDTQIEKWEKKIKDSVLRRDNQLGNLITGMTTAMMQSFEVNGKSVNWGTFGVATLGYMNAEKNKNYEYHIDGDSEDSTASSKQDKLRAALAEDPDSVIEFMKQMTSSVYKAIGDKMASTAVSSAYTVYNDKEMASEYSDYTSLIKKWTTKVSDLEESYYKKFANMESTLAKIQGNSSSISSLFG